MAYDFQIRNVYTFTLYPDHVFDTDFKNVTVMGILDYEMASRYADIYPLHVQVYPSLPEGTPNDPRSYDYILVKTTAGNNVVLGIPWIKENTIELVDSKTIQVLISNASAIDISRVRNALLQNGYTQLDITLVD